MNKEHISGGIKRFIAAVWLTLAAVMSTEAQDLIPIGSWRSHYNYDQTKLVLATEEGQNAERIYCSTESAMFFLDLGDNSLNRVTRTDGLSDISINALGYSVAADWLIIGYASGNIDLYRDNEIINLPEILNAQLTGSAQINHISVSEERAYLSADFGIVLLDLQVPEIRESYLNLGPQGQEAKVWQSYIMGDSIYAATEFGLIAGNIVNGDNLLDFQNWARVDASQPVGSSTVEFINAVGNTLVAGDGTNLYQRTSDNNWIPIPLGINDQISWVSSAPNDLIAIDGDRLITFELATNERNEIEYRAEQQPKSAIQQGDGTFWIADGLEGLFGGTGTGFENLSLPGPATDVTTKAYYYDNRLFALHGVAIPGEPSPIEAYSMFDGSWVTQSISAFSNQVDLMAQAASGVHIISFGDGLLDLENMEITDSTTPGGPFPASSANPESTLLSGVGFDSGGNLWVAQYDSPLPYHQRDNSGNWESYSFSFAASTFPLSMVINEFDDVWARLDPDEGGGIFVFNAETNQQVLLTNRENEGNLPSLNVTDVVFDRTGEAWIGTDVGIAFIPNPFNIFDDGGFDAIRPIFDNGFLLDNEFITAIAIDGGNNKWIGTRNGAWLFNDNGEELLENLTTDNSPLPDNNILDIEINSETGEVFLATAGGLVSFRGRATAATEEHQQVTIFPNPVRPGFTGEIGISGLAQDAVVKITDIGGRLIIETTAEGGTATWNGRGFGGNPAESGIYLVFSASPDGDDTFVGKIAIVR